MRVRHHQRVTFGICQRLLHTRQLDLSAFAGPCLRIKRDLAQLCLGPVPDTVNQIDTGHQIAALGAHRLAQALHCAGGQQPRIIGNFLAGLHMRGQPVLRRRVDKMLRIKHICIHLFAHLHRITAIDKNCGALGQHNGQTCRAGKAGEPF